MHFCFSRPITTGRRAVTPATPVTASPPAPTRAPVTWRQDSVPASLVSSGGSATAATTLSLRSLPGAAKVRPSHTHCPALGVVGSGGSGEMGCGERGACDPMHVLCHASRALCFSSLPLLPCLSAHPPSSRHQHKAAAAVIELQRVGETAGKGFPTRKEWTEITELSCRAP